MYENYGRIGIMAEYPKEVTTDIPEHAYLKNDPYTNWDERARGLGRFFKLMLNVSRSCPIRALIQGTSVKTLFRWYIGNTGNNCW